MGRRCARRGYRRITARSIPTVWETFKRSIRLVIFKPTVRWAERVYDPRRIPDLVNSAFQNAFAGKPGPVYLDLPGTSLYVSVDASTVEWTCSERDSTAPRRRRGTDRQGA